MKLKNIGLIIILFSWIGPLQSQDLAQIAMRARINLYDTWNFDSVGYYLDQVIGKRYAPAFAYTDYGWYLMLKGKFTEGISNLEKAVKTDPSDKQIMAWYAWGILWSNDLSKAKRIIDQALKLDPNFGESLYVASLIATAMGDHDKAINLAKKATSHNPRWRAGVPVALAKAGRTQEAPQIVEKIQMDINRFDAIKLADYYAIIGDKDKALDYLELSYDLHHEFLPWIEYSPYLQGLKNEPRFKALVYKMNLPDS